MPAVRVCTHTEFHSRELSSVRRVFRHKTRSVTAPAALIVVSEVCFDIYSGGLP